MRPFTVLILACGLAACARNELPNAFPLEGVARLEGGACVGAAGLPQGWKLFSQKLDPDDEAVSPALFLLRAPEPEYIPLFHAYVAHNGLIDVQVRDLANAPSIGGTRTYQDEVLTDLRHAAASRSTEQAAGLTFEGYRAGDTQYFIAGDAAQTLITCTPPGSTTEAGRAVEAECKVSVPSMDGKYRITPTFTYDRHLGYADMIAQAEAAVAKAFVPCG